MPTPFNRWSRIPDRVYWSHEVMVEGDLFIARLGKRCFGPVQFRVTRAKLLWMGAGDEPMPPARNLAPVLAERLGTDEAEAVLLGYDVILNEVRGRPALRADS